MKDAETRRFPLRTVLTVTTDRLLTRQRSARDNGIVDLFQILEWMVRDDLYWNQISRAADECRPWLFRWFPELARVEERLAGLDAIKEQGDSWQARQRKCLAWLDTVRQDLGLSEYYDIPRIPDDNHERIDPYDELVIERGTDEGIILLFRPETGPTARENFHGGEP